MNQLGPEKPLAGVFLAAGASNFRDAVEHVWRLPYGRTPGGGLLAPIENGRGTCSTKHLLLKHLADEAGIPAELRLGIYLMKEANTPGVGRVLTSQAPPLDAMPEAHCWLVVGDLPVDVTRWGMPGVEPVGSFLHEETVAPDDLAARKVPLHREWLVREIDRGWGDGRSLDELWAIREACIGALSS
jgi:hypothetical protein